jgi:hypothetical protein
VLSSDDLMTLTKDSVMTETRTDTAAAAYEAAAAKHFSAADQAALAANGYRGMHVPDSEWPALNAEAARLMAIGDPNSPEAIDLARRWMTKVFAATGGDPALTRKMRTVARETLEQPAFQAASESSLALMDFVGQAYGAAIAAGVMPKPENP